MAAAVDSFMGRLLGGGRYSAPMAPCSRRIQHQCAGRLRQPRDQSRRAGPCRSTPVVLSLALVVKFSQALARLPFGRSEPGRRCRCCRPARRRSPAHAPTLPDVNCCAPVWPQARCSGRPAARADGGPRIPADAGVRAVRQRAGDLVGRLCALRLSRRWRPLCGPWQPVIRHAQVTLAAQHSSSGDRWCAPGRQHTGIPKPP